MEKIDLSLINQEKLKMEKTNKMITNSSLLGQFLLLQNNIFKLIKEFSIYEFCLWIKFMNLYISRKNQYLKPIYNKSDILYVELGANIGSELSYIHPCVVIETTQDELLVIPCSSSKVDNIYNKKGEKYQKYIIAEVEDGFNKKTILMLNNIKWISKTRVLKKMGKVETKLMATIYSESFKYNYKHQAFRLDKLEKIKEEQDLKIKKIEEKNQELEEENKELKSIIED